MHACLNLLMVEFSLSWKVWFEKRRSRHREKYNDSLLKEKKYISSQHLKAAFSLPLMLSFGLRDRSTRYQAKSDNLMNIFNDPNRFKNLIMLAIFENKL